MMEARVRTGSGGGSETLLMRRVAKSAKHAQISAGRRSVPVYNNAGRRSTPGRRSYKYHELDRRRTTISTPRMDDSSLHFFFRIMRASQLSAEGNTRQDSVSSPMAPPASPEATLARSVDDDVTAADDASTRRISHRDKMPPHVTTAATAHGVDSPWLALRGHNIRLRHQDHVRHAIGGGARGVQSAPPRVVAHSPPHASTSSPLVTRRSVSPRLQHQWRLQPTTAQQRHDAAAVFGNSTVAGKPAPQRHLAAAPTSQQQAQFRRTLDGGKQQRHLAPPRCSIVVKLPAADR